MLELTGYRRADGRYGVRNHLLVLPARSPANAAAEAIAAGVEGAVAVSHEWVGHAGDPDAALVQRTLAGFAANPNVAATLLVAVSDADHALAHAIQQRGGTVAVVTMTDHGGTAATVEAARRQLAPLLDAARAFKRVPMPLSALVIGLECGGSDALSGITANPALGLASDRLVTAGATTILSEIPELVGAEELLAARAVTPAVGDAVRDVIHSFERTVRALGVDIRGAQPTPGNIAGGLTTIEEKSLGAAKKAGNAPVSGVLQFAQAPPSHRPLHHGHARPRHRADGRPRRRRLPARRVHHRPRHPHRLPNRALPQDLHQHPDLRTPRRRHRPRRRPHPPRHPHPAPDRRRDPRRPARNRLRPAHPVRATRQP
jgi:altronate dehydratase large subunit